MATSGSYGRERAWNLAYNEIKYGIRLSGTYKFYEPRCYSRPVTCDVTLDLRQHLHAHRDRFCRRSFASFGVMPPWD
jgi:hypothetical protein